MLVAHSRDAALFLYTDQESEEWRALAGERWRLQQGASLGERMLRCFEEMSDAGRAPLLILGSDSPALPPEWLESWTDRLEQAPGLLGPCEDGGYYAIGCQAPHPGMFEGVQWSSANTLAQTEIALRRCGLAPSCLPMYYDVDTPADLARLAAESRLPARTRQWLRAHYESGPTV